MPPVDPVVEHLARLVQPVGADEGGDASLLDDLPLGVGAAEAAAGSGQRGQVVRGLGVPSGRQPVQGFIQGEQIFSRLWGGQVRLKFESSQPASVPGRRLPAGARVIALTREMGPDTLLRAEALGVAASMRAPATTRGLQAVLEPMLQDGARDPD